MVRSPFWQHAFEKGSLRPRFCQYPLKRPLRFEPLEDRRLLATFTVSNLDDLPVAAANDAPGTLRQAIFDANNLPGEDTIEFDAALTSGGAATILLTQGELAIDESLTILGPAADLLTIDAAQQSRIFNITATIGNIALSGLTLTGGRTTGINLSSTDTTFSGGAIRSLTSGNLTLSASSVTGNRTTGDFASGGGIFCTGNLSLDNSTVSDNHTVGEPARGGGVWAGGDVTLTESIVSGNHTAGSRGAGIYSSTGNVWLNQSTVSGNSSIGSLFTSSGGGGAGIFARDGNVSLNFSTVSDNSTALNYSGGAGIVTSSSGSSITLTGSTVSGNSTSGNNAYGGGILSGGSVTLINSTVSGNSTTGDNASGGGIASEGPVTASNSTIAENTTTGSGAVGAGIWGFRRIAIQESTVSGNISTGSNSPGGGIYARELVTLYESTVSNNHAMHATSAGGGVYQRNSASYYAAVIRGSIVAGNTAGGGSADFKPDSQKTPIVNFSLIGVADGLTFGGNVGNLTGTAAIPLDPLLGPLADHGGPTRTHALLWGSPAIDAGDPGFDPADPDGNPTTDDAAPHDQRGAPFNRVFDGNGAGDAQIDIGAYELQPAGVQGDYNLDGNVDAADYVVWRKALGASVAAPFGGADGDGDTAIDLGDYDVWQAHFGEMPPAIGTGNLAGETSSVEIQGLRTETSSMRSISAEQLGEIIVQTPTETTSAPAEIDAAQGRAAGFGVRETRSIGKDSGSRTGGKVHPCRMGESGGHDLSLLLAIERVGRSVWEDWLASDDHTNEELPADELEIESLIEEPHERVLTMWRLTREDRCRPVPDI